MSIRMDVKIKHPEWLSVSKPESSISLFNRGLLPSNIAGWMIDHYEEHIPQARELLEEWRSGSQS